ncbi:MAG: U32 family peptidase [Candidatus Limiplasma sp.]|nr:U32 family peptidase [Candidatus Limiplasma sp.]
MELLSPAGDEAALRAAVCAGADAVYLGYASFGARASAANFDAEALERAVAYAHLYRVRVYVTVNTLVKPAEVDAVYQVLQTIAACRADAVIVQDLGVARMARENFPGLALHASTQMALHTAAGARFALRHGLRRVVLARECDLPTIAAAAQTGAEVEVFVHGALCAGVSGQCLLSSMAGGRSGNRGRCAQPCRQTVTLNGASAAWLSTRDLCLRDQLPLLQQAGVKALKIEGRLKRPEYVAVVTQSYRRALDALHRGQFQPADAAERESLLQVFHRGGFTVGHALGAEDADICTAARVNHGGVPVGCVAALRGGLAVLKLEKPLHDGDSLRVEAAQDVELRYSGPAQAAEATVRLRPGESVRVGDRVCRTADALQLEAAQALREPPIPVTLAARVRPDEPLRLSASDGRSTVAVEGEPVQVARNRALTTEDIQRSLSRLGESPFTLVGLPQVETRDAFVPVAALNALRRQALEQLAQARRTAFETEAQPSAALREAVEKARLASADVPQAARNHPMPRSLRDTLAVHFFDAALGEDFLQAGANLLLYAPPDWRAEALGPALEALPPGTWVAVPAQLSDAAFAQARPLLQKQAGRLAGVALGSVGQLGFDWPLPVALGEGIPLTNPEALRELLHDRIAFYTLWPELRYEELAALHPEKTACLLGVYGRERLMLLNHCPLRVARGLRTGRAACALCGPGDRACGSPDAALTDRRGFRFPLTRVRMPEGCLLELHNAVPTDLARQENRRRELGAGMLLRFTVETPLEQLAITRRFAALQRGEPVAPPEGETTSGHFLRGVE